MQKEQRSLQTLKRTGQPDIATASYKAPERFRNEQLTASSDVFSFAVMAWELLSGRQPWAEFGELSYDSIQRAIVSGRRPSLKLLDRFRPPLELGRLLEQCWHSDLSQRPQMDVVVGRLQLILHSLLHGLEAFKRRNGGRTMVYRVLHHHDTKRLSQGHTLQAEDPNSILSLDLHVRNGSKLTAPASPFMSTTLSFTWALHYASSLLYTTCSSCTRRAPLASVADQRTHVIVTLVRYRFHSVHVMSAVKIGFSSHNSMLAEPNVG